MTSLRIEVPLTDRLRGHADAWARSPKPRDIPAPGPNEESVWDYPRPPAIERVPVRVQVWMGDRPLADSSRCLRVLETASPPTVYFPTDDVDMARLVSEGGASACEWKGVAHYWGIRTDEAIVHRAAWCYPATYPEYAPLAGMMSFYPACVTRCLYGDWPVRPQPGQFYGGWVTPNLVGPFKGVPGSAGW